MPRKSAVTLCTVALALLAACGESGVDAADVARELQVELPANAHVVTSSAGQPYEDTQGDFCAKVSFLLDHSATSAYVGQHFPKGPLIDETNQAVDVPAPPTYAAATDCTTPANELPTRSPATTAMPAFPCRAGIRTLTSLARSAATLGAEIEFLTPDGFRSVGVPTYPGLRVALPNRREIARRIEEAAPEAIHIATEGPIGWAEIGRASCRERV